MIFQSYAAKAEKEKEKSHVYSSKNQPIEYPSEHLFFRPGIKSN